MDVISYALAKKYVDDTVVGLGAIKGSNCYITSIVDNLDGTHDITFSWKDTSDVTHTSVLTVKDGETPAFSSVVITGGHRLTFTTQDPSQTVSFDVMDGSKGDSGISVVSSNVDDNNNLTFTLSNGNVINAGKIKAVTTVDNALSTTSSNPVENKVITNALNNKVDKESGKGLSTEDFTTAEKDKLSNIEDNAQVNVIEKLIINGTEATVTDKSVALTLITSAVSNLQNYYLKTETYTKTEIEDLIGSTVGVTIEIVEELPTEGQSNVIYFLPTETTDVYSQYIYTADGWILIGSTTVDLSNYYTKTQVDTLLATKQNTLTIDSFPTSLSNNPVASGGVYTAIAQMQSQFQYSNMPTASADNLGYVYQYIGATGTYTQNMFYRCVYDDTLGEYQWQEVIFNATITIDSVIDSTSENPVQNKVIKAALDEKQDIIQYSTMPSAQDNLGKIVQYIGTNTANYTNGYFYKAIYDSESDIYSWTVIKFSADMLVDNALSTTSENPVQNKVITDTINDIQDVIPSEASSTNQLVDRDSLGTASQKNFTPYVSPNNTDLPLSSSVYSAITNAVYGAYHPSGSKTIAELTSDLLVLANIGNVYKITEDGVTTDLFIGGAGQTIHTGDNAVVVYGGQTDTFLFDLQSGSIDLTPYQTKALESAIEGETTVEDALQALSDNKQDTLTFDDEPTENSTNVVKSGGVYSVVDDIYKIMGENGAKNLFPTNKTYYNGRSYTNNGITFVQNDDGSITVSGVATADAQYTLFTRATDWGINIDVGKSYILSGCPSGGSNDTYRLVFGDTQSSAYHRLAIDIGSGAEFTITTASEAYYASSIDVRSGVDLTTPIIFYPMLRLASDTDSTYQPYAMTNQQITPYVQSVSNPNLLDNPWFTVNQRGFTSDSHSGGLSSYSAFVSDRWKYIVNADRAGSVQINSDCSITVSSTNNIIYLAQEIDRDNNYSVFLDGKTFTLSVLLSDGTILSGTQTFYLNTSVTMFTSDNMGARLYSNAPTRIQVALDIYNGKSVTIKAVKLELGKVSTLANDTAPNYAEELLKCQRYYQEFRATSSENMWIASGFSPNGNSIEVVLDLAVPMRTKPSVTITDTYATNAVEEVGLSTIQVLQADVNNSKLHMNILASSSLTNVLGAYALKLIASIEKHFTS